jgi:hypothetical protein
VSNLNTITKVTIAVEINGKPYFVNLPHDRALMVMNMAGGLSDDGRLHVTKAPEGFKFIEIGELE